MNMPLASLHSHCLHRSPYLSITTGSTRKHNLSLQLSEPLPPRLYFPRTSFHVRKDITSSSSPIGSVDLTLPNRGGYTCVRISVLIWEMNNLVVDYYCQTHFLKD